MMNIVFGLRRVLCVFGAAAALAAAVCVVAAPAKAVVTTYWWGHVGYYLAGGPNYCSGYPNTRQVQTFDPTVSATPDYSSSVQKIWMIPGIQYSADGYNWSSPIWGKWQSRAVDRYNQASFSVETLYPTKGGYWRVVEVFYWYVGSTKVGEVRDLFNSDEYFGSLGNDFLGAFVVATEPSFCGIY